MKSLPCRIVLPFALILVLALAFALTPGLAQTPQPQQTITTLVGGDVQNVPATRVGADPLAIAVDSTGNVYYADCSRIYKIEVENGNLTTVAGSGAGCYRHDDDPGNGGPALSATVTQPSGLAVDAAGDIYFGDASANEIREVNATTGSVTVAAGSGAAGYAGDGGPAAQAELNRPSGLALDGSGDLFFIDAGKYVREISRASGNISTVATVPDALGLALDASGDLYIATNINYVATVVRVAPGGGPQTVVAGGGANPPADGVIAGNASFDQLWAVAVDGGGDIFFVAHSSGGAYELWEIPAGTATLHLITVSSAGSGTLGNLFDIVAVASAPSGNLFLAYSSMPGVLELSPGGNFTVLAGDGTACGESARSTTPLLRSMIDPYGASVTPGGGYAADYCSNVIWMLSNTGGISAVAGTGIPGYSGDGGLATRAQLQNPEDVVEDSAGNIYISDTDNNLIREVASPSQIITTYAGHYNSERGGDGGPATAAGLGGPQGLALDAEGNLYIADPGNDLIRRVDAVTHIITSVAGGAAGLDGGDGGPATSASLNSPSGVFVDSSGNLYIADYGNGADLNGNTIADSTIRRVDAKTGIITTVAGVGDPGGQPPNVAIGSGDGGPATAAGLTEVSSVAVDSNGNIYIADFGAAKVREVVAATGNIYTLAGTGVGGVSGDNGPATKAELRPCGVRLDDEGNLYVADCDAGRVREIANAVGGLTMTFSNAASASTGDLEFGVQQLNTSATQTVTIANPGLAPMILTGITARPNSSSDFTESNNCPATLTTGQSCTVTVNFTPTSTKNESAQYAVGNNVTIIFAYGQGGAASVASLSVSSLAFPAEATGTTSPGQMVVLSNGNFDTATLTDVAAQTTGPFSAASECNGSVDGGQNCEIVVTFTPTARGPAAGTLMVSDNASGSPQTVTLSGTDIAPAAVAALFPAALNFTNQPQGVKSNAQAVLLTNTGTAALAISSITAVGANAGDFAVTNNCGASLSPSAACEIVVTNTPSTASAEAADLTITDGAGISPQAVALSGSGAVTPSIITTVAGLGPQNLPATAAADESPQAMAYDAVGDLFLANASTRRVLKITPNGIVILVAGNGTSADSGDGGPATAAGLGNVSGLAVDPKGNLFISDAQNNVVREVTPNGNIATYAGTSAQLGYTGDGGPAQQAELNHPWGLAIDAAGNLYIADEGNNRIREVSASTGVITTFAGNGTQVFASGLPPSGPATSTSVTNPTQVAVDQAGDVFFLVDRRYVLVVKAGSGMITSPSLNGMGEALANSMAVDAAGRLYGAANTDVPNGLDVGWIVDNAYGSSTIGGGATTLPAAFGGPASVALIQSLTAMTVSPAGLVTFAADGYVAQVDANGNLQPIVGDGSLYDSADGLPALASSAEPGSLARDAAGNVYFASSDEVRELVAATGELVTVAGNGTFPVGVTGTGDGGAATKAQINPHGIALDATGDLYIADPAAVREVNAVTGLISTIAGTGHPGYSGDGGPATQAQVDQPRGLAVDSQGDVFIADAGGYNFETKSYTYVPRVWELVASTGVLRTVAGGSIAGLGDGGPATSAEIWVPYGLGLDATGNLYIADQGNSTLNAASRVREVNMATGTITTVAGGGSGTGNGDGGPATQATLAGATGVTVDAYGNVLIADNLGYAIRRVDAASGIISTVAGNGTYGISGDGGPATQTEIGAPNEMVLDPAGNLYFSADGTIREVEALAPAPALTPAALSFGSQLTGQTSAVQTLTLNNPGSDAWAMTSIAINGAGTSAGFAETNTCGTSLASGASCAISVTFAPSAAGAAAGTVTVTPALGAALTSALSGTGTTPSPVVTLAPASLMYASQLTTTSSAAQTVTLTNGGNATLTLTSIAVTGANAGDFSQSNNCGTSVAAGANCTISVTFTPTAAGSRTASVTITGNAANSPQSVALSGTGTTPAPAVTLAPASLTYASQLTTTSSAAQTVTLTNGGNAALTLTSIAVTGANAGDFSQSNTCGSSVAAGANCSLSVTFAPTATGARSASITITDNAPDSPESVALTGSGADLTIAPASGSSPTATTPAGQPANFALQFTPVAGATGVYALSCTGAPTGATCTPNPPSINLSGTTPVNVTVTVTTTARSASMTPPPPSSPSPWEPWMLLITGLVLAGLAPTSLRRKWARKWLAPLAAAALLSLCIACGGGGGGGAASSNNPPAATGTPAGTYQLTVTAAGAGGNIRSTHLSLTVQ